jgi:hypothetical protein
VSETGACAADPFARCRARLETLIGFLEGSQAVVMAHAELEQRVGLDGREVLRLALQGHLDMRAEREERRDDVCDAEGVARRSVEAGHERMLATVFGEVIVTRLAYRQRGRANLHPADRALNLPLERHSHGLRELAGIETARGSFDGAVEAIGRGTGQTVAKRQVEQLATRAAVDFEAFYANSPRSATMAGDVVVVSADGKGIVMRPHGLRPATADAAAKATTKLDSRLSKGEKRNRKRLAEVGAVYELTPVARTAVDILATSDSPAASAPAAPAKNKWLTASIVDDAATVIARIFDEAERRDPHHQRTWVALVDGNNHQIRRITTEATARGLTITIIVDLIHVLEYLWKAAWCFYDEGDTTAETWVHTKALAVLNGHASTVAASIRRKATCLRLDPHKRVNADTCADYLHRKRRYLDYPTALTNGWPIATGIIEGACRHLVKDRMDITGARWSADGAEAILKLRALQANHDFPAYWQFHLAQERQRVHDTRYLNSAIPRAA